MKGESRPNSGILLAEFPLRFPSRVNLVQENPEKIGSDYQRTRTVETIRRRAALPKYLVHGFRRGSHRRDWAEWIGQVYHVGDADNRSQFFRDSPALSLPLRGTAAEIRQGVFRYSDEILP